MTTKTFYQELQRGLGSAFTELKKNPDNIEYRDALLRCCLRYNSYDLQIEGSRGFYLYNAILETENPDYFLQPVLDKFLSNCSNGIFFHIIEIVYCYAYDGNQLAKDAFYKKYDYFANKKFRLTKNINTDEGRQWDEVAYNLTLFDGFDAFKRYAIETGEIRIKYPNNRKTYDGWYIFKTEYDFGEKRIERYLTKNCEKSPAIKALFDTIKSDKLVRELNEKRNQNTMTIQELIETATVASTHKKNPRYKMRKLRKGRKFSAFRASEQELTDLAHAALNEENLTIKALLLNEFSRDRFPLDITPLMEYAKSDNKLLAETSIDRLKKLKDEKIRNLAIELLTEKGVNSFALGLLEKNYKKSDDAVILSEIKKIRNISHDVQQDIVNIYTCHRSKNAFPILFRVYKKGKCAFCREGVIEAMEHCGVLTNEIIDECLYDSYDDIQKKAKKLKKKFEKKSQK